MHHLLVYFVDDVGFSISHKPVDLHGLLGGSFTFVCVDDIRTSQETHLWAATASCGDMFTFYM
jgi:hypothetical protein